MTASAPFIAGALILFGLLHTVECSGIQHVHVIFANHLDIGYHCETGQPGNDKNVLNQYQREYLVSAARIAAEMRQRGGHERYRYLTHSYLVSLYLDCPQQLGIYCPPPEDIAVFKAAVAAGDITWHAFPFNAQVEVMDAELLQYAVQLTHDLDDLFHLPHKRVMSQRDVPGLTRAAVPLLANAGVAALSVGVNSGSAPLVILSTLEQSVSLLLVLIMLCVLRGVVTMLVLTLSMR